jgi:two-component system capsular synthesis response regulator RcsB
MDTNGLTERQQDILRLYSTGAKPDAIAKKLKMSPKTVAVHKHNIKAKLGIKSEFDLIRWCMKNVQQPTQ